MPLGYVFYMRQVYILFYRGGNSAIPLLFKMWRRLRKGDLMVEDFASLSTYPALEKNCVLFYLTGNTEYMLGSAFIEAQAD